MADQPSCGTCRFYDCYREDRETGSCRRYPPVLSEFALKFYVDNPDEDDGEVEEATVETIMLRQLRGMDVWFLPRIHESDWCGEYQSIAADVR